ncbi:MAG: ATP-binding protein [Cyanobacteria bacterium J06638_7]
MVGPSLEPSERPAPQPGELRLQRTLPGHRQELPPALEALDDLLQAAGLEEEERGELRLLAEEVLMNIVAYAFAGGPARPIQLHCLCTAAQVSLEFRDSGQPFNPLEAEPPNLAAPLQERVAGGLGIHLIRSLADTVTYQYRHGCNVLLVSRRRRSADAAPGSC